MAASRGPSGSRGVGGAGGPGGHLLDLLEVVEGWGEPAFPAWLSDDLSGIRASFTPSGNALERCVASLRSTQLAARQNRWADPIMVDHMLCHNSLGSEA